VLRRKEPTRFFVGRVTTKEAAISAIRTERALASEAIN
jgi:hypothetical protein